MGRTGTRVAEVVRGPDQAGAFANGAASIDVVVLTSRACHLCEDAVEGLTELAHEFPIRVREIGMDTPEGRELVRIHRPAMPPAILVDGALFGVGRPSRKKLRRYLERKA